MENEKIKELFDDTLDEFMHQMIDLYKTHCEFGYTMGKQYIDKLTSAIVNNPQSLDKFIKHTFSEWENIRKKKTKAIITTITEYINNNKSEYKICILSFLDVISSLDSYALVDGFTTLQKLVKISWIYVHYSKKTTTLFPNIQIDTTFLKKYWKLELS